MRNRSWIAPVAALLLMCDSAVAADITFEEVAQASGIDEVGRSWGGYWGDFNDDGFPDVWTTNHGREPSFYLNNGDGTFTNVAQQVISPEVWTRYNALDAHGASWADFDNDGDQDLFENAAGGSRNDPNNLYRNLNGVSFDEVAPLLGVSIPDARPRTPMWLDWNSDGLLDLMITATGARTTPVILMEQGNDSFGDKTADAGLTGNAFVEFAILSDLTGDNVLEASTSPVNANLRVFSLGHQALQEITESLGLTQFNSIADVGAGDFDGDLQAELFMVQGELNNGFDQPDGNTLEARLNATGSEVGLQFSASDAVTFSVWPAFQTSTSEINIGAAGVQPVDTEFTLIPTDPQAQGIAPHDPGVTNGLFVGYDSDTELWSVLFSHTGNKARNLVITSPAAISGVSTVGFDANELPENNLLLDRQGGVYVDTAAQKGTQHPDSGRNVAIGDFDNDGDLDAYVVATGPVTGKPNVLYANNGDGTFNIVADAGGASGTLDGRGDAVSVADFNRDGWLDLLVTNGKSKAPFERDGPYELFRNAGGTNHWLEIDLEAVNSNRDAIGARVELSAGGVTQMREQTSGMHFRSQDHKRLHFGLGSADVVDEIVVRWPDGRLQSAASIPADQVVEIIESVPVSVLGEPAHTAGSSDDKGVYVWKESLAGEYHFSVRGDISSTEYTIHLVADAAPLKLAGDKLEAGDSLVTTPYGFAWSGRVADAEDSVVLTLPQGTRAMFSVTLDGVSNPRQVRMGSSMLSPTPAGWIVPVDSLGQRPAFSAGSDLGLFVGRGDGTSEVQAYWSADAMQHSATLELLASDSLISAKAQSFEAEDTISVDDNAVTAMSIVAGEWDGIDVVVPDGAIVALGYLQDNLFQRRSVNLAVSGLSQPNAYWLPIPKEEDRPIIRYAPTSAKRGAD